MDAFRRQTQAINALLSSRTSEQRVAIDNPPLDRVRKQYAHRPYANA